MQCLYYVASFTWLHPLEDVQNRVFSGLINLLTPQVKGELPRTSSSGGGRRRVGKEQQQPGSSGRHARGGGTPVHAACPGGRPLNCQPDWRAYVRAPPELHPQATPEQLAFSRQDMALLTKLDRCSTAMSPPYPPFQALAPSRTPPTPDQRRQQQQQQQQLDQPPASHQQHGFHEPVMQQAQLLSAGGSLEHGGGRWCRPPSHAGSAAPHHGCCSEPAGRAQSSPSSSGLLRGASGQLTPQRSSEPYLPALLRKFSAPEAATASGAAQPRGLRRSTSALDTQPRHAAILPSPFGSGTFPSPQRQQQQLPKGPPLALLPSGSFNSTPALSSPFGSQTLLTSRQPSTPLPNPFSNSCGSGSSVASVCSTGSAMGSSGFGRASHAARFVKDISLPEGNAEDTHQHCLPQPGLAGVNLRKELHIGALGGCPLTRHLASGSLVEGDMHTHQGL